MKTTIKRAYDDPEKSDGTRILVDRLWPRGVSKEDAQLDNWIKELTPSNDLRKWFHQDCANRYDEFRKKLKEELKDREDDIKNELPNKDEVTLVTGVKEEDFDHSHLPTVQNFLKKY